MTTLTRPAKLAPVLGACLTATIGLVIAGSAAAQSTDVDGVRSIHVHYADLNLGSQAGAREMLARIQDAARRACGGEVDLRMLERRALFNRCKTETVDRAVHELDASLVTAMAAHSGAVAVLARR